MFYEFDSTPVWWGVFISTETVPDSPGPSLGTLVFRLECLLVGISVPFINTTCKSKCPLSSNRKSKFHHSNIIKWMLRVYHMHPNSEGYNSRTKHSLPKKTYKILLGSENYFVDLSKLLLIYDLYDVLVSFGLKNCHRCKIYDFYTRYSKRLVQQNNNINLTKCLIVRTLLTFVSDDHLTSPLFFTCHFLTNFWPGASSVLVG